ncbi:MAG: hypothetical protein QY303_04620 [Vicingaceae bacterium]|nr:MAG: hypothetical protein QY303_04620 [Vicingaceae bacterium]
MEQLKTIIQKTISSKSTVDWMVVHDISKSKIEIEGVDFSFVDGLERYNEPFKTNQGYISLNKPSVVIEFQRIANELLEEFKSNPIALANLFIVFTRASYKGEDKETLLKNFKKQLGKEVCTNIFNLLISSLNNEYYKDNHSIKKPLCTNDWLDIFRSTQYMHGISDPLINCLQLVRNERNRKLNYDLLEKMKPLLRAVLVGQYGFDLEITKGKLKTLYQNSKELIFLSACLVDDSAPDKTPPDWLTETLIEKFLENHWDTIGKQIFVHFFGLSYRNKNDNKLYDHLKQLSHVVLLKKIKTENAETVKWISKFVFPNDFIALFSWLSLNKISPSEIPDSNRIVITNQFVSELQRIAKEIPIHLASENSSDPFTSFQLYEGKFQNALAYVLLFLLSATDSNRKDIENVCHEFKTLFYGGFRATYLATHFTELMLLIGLSGIHIYGLEEGDYLALEQYLKIISDTVLISYIHLKEREDEVWNPESERDVFQWKAGSYLVTNALTNVRKHEILKHYQDFFKTIDDIKVSKWNFQTK